MRSHATERGEHERGQSLDRRRQTALRLEVRDCPARRRIGRVPRLSDDLAVVRRVSGERLGTAGVRPAEDHAADAMRPRRLRQRRHERGQERQPAERQPDDQRASRNDSPPAARVTRTPAPKPSGRRHRESENLPRNKLPTRALRQQRRTRQSRGSDRERPQQGPLTVPREPPPQASCERDDDHGRIDVGAHLNPPSSQVQSIQTRRRTAQREGGPHSASV
jgi:hypothetical protein